MSNEIEKGTTGSNPNSSIITSAPSHQSHNIDRVQIEVIGYQIGYQITSTTPIMDKITLY